jgi:hypothetical protein
MAYFNSEDQDKDEEQSQGMNNTEQKQGNPSQPVQLSNPSSVATNTAPAAPTAASSAPKAGKPASSGSAPGFQSYTKANQGKAQENLNSATAQAVASSGQNATNAIQNSQKQFDKKVEAGTLANRFQAVQDVANTTNSARGVAAVPNQDAPGLLDQVQGLDRFKEVINAEYQGPESLRQAGLYNQISGKVDNAQNVIKNTKTAQGREDMLKNMYQQRADYTSGLNKLDSALLNSSQKGVQNLQNVAQAQGNLGQKLDKAQINSSNLAQNRTDEINKIRNEARDTFSSGKKAEEAATEARMDDMLVTPVKDAAGNIIKKADGTPMTQWDQLPESFKDVIRNKEKNNASMLATETSKLGPAVAPAQLKAAKKAYEQLALGADENFARMMAGFGGPVDEAQLQASLAKGKAAFAEKKAAYDQLVNQDAAYNKQLAQLQQQYNPNAVNFNSAEAQILGIGSGQGLYNLGENAIKQGVADRNRLISKDEQARQAVLAQLAGLDLSKTLDTNLKYADADAAGTQSIMDSLDIDGTRAGLNEADANFARTADATDLTGEGKKKVSRGNMFGKKTETYHASVDGNVEDMLKQAGYNFDGVDANNSTLQGKDLLNAAIQASKHSDDSGDKQKQDAQRQMQAGLQGAGTGAAIGSVIPGVGTGIGATAGLILGRMVGSGTVDPLQQNVDLLNGFAPGAGQVVQDVRNKAGDLYGTLAQYNPANIIADKISDMFGGSSVTKGISGAISGIDTGAMKAFGSAKARENAIEDLQNKYKSFLGSQGFENRANVVNNDLTSARATALQNLLASFDKTNT